MKSRKLFALLAGAAVIGIGAWHFGPSMFQTYDSCVEKNVNSTQSTFAQGVLLAACKVIHKEKNASAKDKEEARCVLDKMTGAQSWVIAMSRLEECDVEFRR